MKRLALFALALLLSASTARAKGNISITFDSDDSGTELVSRKEPADAKLAITSRDGSTVLMLMNNAVAIQLSDRALADVHPKKESGFLEELLVSGVRIAVGKAIECPLATIRTAEIRNGALVLTNVEGKPVFSEVKVNGTDVLRNFTTADATRFVAAVRMAKGKR